MADPIQVVCSLESLADHYAVFEPDQVLTHGQLNSVSDFWGDQVRLSRVALAAVGLVSGLHVARAEGGVRVTRGLGVSTDGDLMTLAADTLYDRFRPYDTTAPVYRPFYRGTAEDGTPTEMIALQELVPVGESDVLARPLADLANELQDRAVLMLMETVVNDPDLCTGTDCDNLGRDALQRVRLLLIGRREAQDLLDRRPLRPASERAQALPALAMRRPALGRDIVTTATLAGRYRDATRSSLDDLLRALPTLLANCPEVLLDMFSADPTPRWNARLADLATLFTRADTGLQAWYGFVKDLIDQWNELREALLADDSVLLPNVAAFPKHLLLGALAAPREQRSGLYPSPLDATSRQQSAHARFLAWKLGILIDSFDPPADTVVRITPSVADDCSLEERAIPWFYRVLAEAPINVGWNFRLSTAHHEGHNLGYRSTAWASTARARDPLAFAIGGNDFFRVEGHLGRAVETVSAEIRRLIDERNLPFQVQPVLLHNSRDRIRIRPPFRYTPLHSLHYLVRNDVAFRLEESVQFGQRHVADVTEAVDKQLIFGTAEGGASVIGAARSASDAVTSASRAAAPVLSTRSYSNYKAAVGSDQGALFKSSYASSLASVGDARANLGFVSRADFVSPFDGLINTNQPHWIDWLDDLIAGEGNKADDKLLLSRFVQDHPGLDHLGGVWRGGTFVLVYDDQGQVVADFTLPYPAAEAETPEAEDPPLTRPPYRPPLVVGTGIRVIKPIDLVVKDRFMSERVVFQKDLDLQSASIEGLIKGAFVPNNAVRPKLTADLPGLTDTRYLDFQTKEMAYQRDRVKELQDMLTQPGVPDEVRVQVERDLGRAQVGLADTVGVVAEQLVAAGVDVASPAGAQITQAMTTSLSSIQSVEAKQQLDLKLQEVQSRAVGGQAAMLGNLRKIGRF